MGRFLKSSFGKEDEIYSIKEVLKLLKEYLSQYYRSPFDILVTNNANNCNYEVYDVETNHIIFSKDFAKRQEYCSFEELCDGFKHMPEIIEIIKKLDEFDNTSFNLSYIAKCYIAPSTIRLNDLMLQKKSGKIYYNPRDFLQFLAMLININEGNDLVFVETKRISELSKTVGDVKIRLEYSLHSLKKSDDVLFDVSSELTEKWFYEYDAAIGGYSTNSYTYEQTFDEADAVSLVEVLISKYPFLYRLKNALIERKNISVNEICFPYVFEKRGTE